MKVSIRLISTVLCLMILAWSLTSCFSVGNLGGMTSGETTAASTPGQTANSQTTAATTLKRLPSGTTTGNGNATGSTTAQQTTTGSGGSQGDPVDTYDFRYPYVMTEEEVDAYYDLLAEIEADALGNRVDGEALMNKVGEMEEMFYYISTQSSLAYVEYCYFGDEESEQNYLYASGASTDAYTAYMETCLAILESESPLKAVYFEGWTEADLNEVRSYSGEISELNKISQNILVDYRALEDAEFTDGAAELLMKLVECNQDIAELEGYKNYIEYAYAEVYTRDYGMTELEYMRSQVKEVIVPLCIQAYDKFQTSLMSLKAGERARVIAMVESDYDRLSLDFLGDYLDTLPEDVRAAMQGMFDDENAIFSDEDFSDPGAFTGYLYSYETPMAYFGPGYQNLFTVAHELGHYYYYTCNASASLSYDLAELHSQGNEFLLLASLKDYSDVNVIRTVGYYQIFNTLFTIINCAIIDEFESYVYLHADEITDPTTQLDEIMDKIFKSYDQSNFLAGNIDINNYWRRVVIESPLYYISYAMSGLMSLELYAIALEDYEAATATYRFTVEGADGTRSFLEVLEEAGLGNPFSKETYDRLETICS